MASDTSLIFNLIAKDKASAVIGNMQEKINTAATGIAAGVAGALGVGVAQAMDTQAITSKLGAQLGMTTQEAGEFGAIAGRLYTKGLGDSAQDGADTLRALFQNDLVDGGIEDIEALASSVMTLGKTFDVESNEISVAVSQMLRTGMAESGQEALDIIATGFQNGANKADDLLETLNEYSTQWRRVGLDGKTSIGLITQAVQAGARDADQVADAIGQFGERALAGGKPIEDAFKSIGLNADQMAKMIGAGGDQAQRALQLTMDGMRGASSEQVKLNAAAALFGDPGNVLGAALFALNPATAAAAGGMDNAAGAVDRMSKTISDNPTAALEKFKREAMAKLGEVGGELVKFGMDNRDVMQPLLITLGGLAAAILLIKGAMLAWTAAQAAWAAGQAVVTAATWLWNTALLASPITWIIIGIVALVAAIVLLWQHSETFRNIVLGAWAAIKSGLATALNWITGTLWPGIKGVWDGIVDGVRGVGRWVGDTWAGIVTAVTGLPARIGRAAAGMWDGIGDAFRSTINWIIRHWNALRFGVPQFDIPGIGKVGGGTFGVPPIPLLASGGIIPATPGGRLAVIGEGGEDEAVIPLSKLASMGGRTDTLRIEFAGPEEMVRLIRKAVANRGGSVQSVLGS